jgi:pimeloyl-ACP methyl ester carboxylesterase
MNSPLHFRALGVIGRTPPNPQRSCAERASSQHSPHADDRPVGRPARSAIGLLGILQAGLPARDGRGRPRQRGFGRSEGSLSMKTSAFCIAVAFPLAAACVCSCNTQGESSQGEDGVGGAPIRDGGEAGRDSSFEAASGGVGAMGGAGGSAAGAGAGGAAGGPGGSGGWPDGSGGGPDGAAGGPDGSGGWPDGAGGGGAGDSGAGGSTLLTGRVLQTGIHYTSTLDSLPLVMDVAFDADRRPSPILLVLHGYSGPFQGTEIPERFARKGLFAIKTYKRGFGGSGGSSDDSGRETHDFYDAIQFVKSHYAQYVDPMNVNVVGYSGGGGNTYALLTKFPDLLRSANVFFGMSDYGYDDTYGWWNNGGSSYRNALAQRIGGTPTDVRERYHARAHHLGAGNNRYSHIQLFYDEQESTCPLSHAEQYVKWKAATSDVVQRISDNTTSTVELQDSFSAPNSLWKQLGPTPFTISGNALRWTTYRTQPFDGASGGLMSLRNYGATDHIATQFDLTIESGEKDATTLIGFRRSQDASLKNSIAIGVQIDAAGKGTLFLRVDYNGSSSAPAGNREYVWFQDATNNRIVLALNRTYPVGLTLNNGVVYGSIDLPTDGGVSRIQPTLTLADTANFDGIDSFGIMNYPLDPQPAGAGMAGRLESLTVQAYSRWIHGYPMEGTGGSEGNITAENYFVPGILAGTWPRRTLAPNGELFIPGFVRTEAFFVMLGQGTDAAGKLTYDVSGDGTSSAGAKSFTVDPLPTDAKPVVSLDLYGLQPNRSYRVEMIDPVTSVQTSASVDTDGAGSLHCATGQLAGKRTFRVFLAP